MVNNEILQQAIDNARKDPNFNIWKRDYCILAHIENVLDIEVNADFFSWTDEEWAWNLPQLSDDAIQLLTLNNILWLDFPEIEETNEILYSPIDMLVRLINENTEFSVS